MKSVKRFHRFVRQEMYRISIMLKQMEFRTMRLRGMLRRKMREQIMELRRMRDAILHRLSVLTGQGVAPEPAMQAIRDDITLLQQRCRALRLKHL